VRERFNFTPPNERCSRAIERANEIIVEYAADGYRITLRQLFYQLVARGRMENTAKNYDRLGEDVRRGRDAGIIDWDDMVDLTREWAKRAQGWRPWSGTGRPKR
jgi:hypothetical protein